MKKYIIICSMVFIFLNPYKTYAIDYKQEIDDIADRYNITQESISGVTIEDVFNYIKDQVLRQWKEPIKIVAKLSGVILLCAVIKTIQEKSAGVDIVTDSLCTIIVFLTLLSPLGNIIGVITDNLIRVKNLMTSFLPVYAGISMASGEVITSTVYTGFFLSGLVFVSDFCVNVILPTIQLYFALIISNALSPVVRLKSICEFYIKSVRWIMRGIVSVICFVLTIQTTISQGSDTFAVKAGKALAGTAVPVIGSVLQDAIGSVYASMEVIKGFAGVVGIIAVLHIFLPSVIILGIYWVYINFLYILCDVFEIKGISECVKGFSNVTELCLSVIFLFIILLVFSLTIMISLTNGV